MLRYSRVYNLPNDNTTNLIKINLVLYVKPHQRATPEIRVTRTHKQNNENNE